MLVRYLFLLSLLSSLSVSTQSQSLQAQYVTNVIAFARLYGVVRYFYPGDGGAEVDWDRFAVYGVTRVIEAQDSTSLQLTLKDLFMPIGAGIDVASQMRPPETTASTQQESLVSWQYAGPAVGSVLSYTPYSAWRTNRPLPPSAARSSGTAPQGKPLTSYPTDPIAAFELAKGLYASVRLTLSDEEARRVPSELANLRRTLAALDDPKGLSATSVRLADVVHAWGTFRHFYPYWNEVGTEWDSVLAKHIKAAYDAKTRLEHQRALQVLVADAQDGHGIVTDPLAPRTSRVGIRLRVIDNSPVIIASDRSEQAPVGATVRMINDLPAMKRFEDEMLLVSGSLQWRRWQASQNMSLCPQGATELEIVVQTPLDLGHKARLPCNAARLPNEARPDQLSELSPDVWYVDITRSQWKDVAARLNVLARARAVIVDVRGYPTDAGAMLLRHLMTFEDRDTWMHIPYYAGPFGRVASWQSSGWDVQPSSPQVSGRRFFLADGRAISYAESVLGHIADHRLATIVGSTTAGTNGNMAGFNVPSGFAIGFTGMRVTRHDGRTPHHLLGVVPDVYVEPSLSGIQQSRDEVLERALALAGVVVPAPRH